MGTFVDPLGGLVPAQDVIIHGSGTAGGGGTGGGALPVAAATGTWTDRSSTVAAGTVSQTLAAANTARQQILILNPPSATESLFFNWTSAASTTDGKSIELSPGGSYDSGLGPVSTQAITVTAVTTGHVYVAKEM